jgi:hypothetical protein
VEKSKNVCSKSSLITENICLGFFYCLIVCTVCRQKRRSLAKQAATSNLIPMRKVEVLPKIQINIELPSGIWKNVFH